jgi:hypothetical protein
MTQPAHVHSARPSRKLGRLPADPSRPRLNLDRYTSRALISAVPATVDYLSQVTSGWPMYGNDTLGDCTAAAAGHLEEVWSNYGQGRTVTVTDNAVLEFYSACSGYVPGRPDTDQGAVMQDCLKVWRTPGVGGHEIAAFFAVNPTNHDLIRTALYLFGGLYVGVNLPVIAQDQFEQGVPWDVVRNDGGLDGGHCIHLGAASTTGNYAVTTWGQVQQVTPAWWGRYVEEVWAPVSAEWVRAGLSPEGLDVATLNADFQALTGQPGPFPPAVTPPAPTPTPGPTPTPPAPTPVPPVDPDVALAGALRSWLRRRRYGASRTLAEEATAWLASKHL